MDQERVANVAFVAIALARLSADAPAWLIAKEVAGLEIHVSSLRRRWAAMCSYEWANTDDYVARTDKLEARLSERVAKLASIEGLAGKVSFRWQRDPRGAALVLLVNGAGSGGWTQTLYLGLRS